MSEKKFNQIKDIVPESTYETATKKVPAPNKWYRVPYDGVDISNVSGAKKVYFANTTIPNITEIVKVSVPERPKISKATYATWCRGL